VKEYTKSRKKNRILKLSPGIKYTHRDVINKLFFTGLGDLRREIISPDLMSASEVSIRLVSSPCGDVSAMRLSEVPMKAG